MRVDALSVLVSIRDQVTQVRQTTQKAEKPTNARRQPAGARKELLLQLGVLLGSLASDGAVNSVQDLADELG